MLDTIARYIVNVPDRSGARALQFILGPIADRLSSQVSDSAGLAIFGAASPIVKAVNVFHAFANGVPVLKAANTNMAALAGTVLTATFNVFCFYIDSGGNLTSAMGTAGVAFTNIVFPIVPVRQAMIGYVIINPTGAGSFVGGTTNLDDATVVPNAVYVNTIGAFDPSIILGF